MRRMHDKAEIIEIVEEHGGGGGVSKQYVDQEVARVEAEIPSVEGLASEQFVVNKIAEAGVSKQDKLESYSDRASVSGDTLTINYKVRQDDDTYEDVPVSFTAGGGSGSVEIDEKTIIRDDDGKLKTSIGGYIEGTPSEKIINAAEDVNLVWNYSKNRYNWDGGQYNYQFLVANRLAQGLEPLAALSRTAYDNLELNHEYPITLNGEAATIRFSSRAATSYNTLTGVITYRDSEYNVLLDYGTESVWANIKITTRIDDMETVTMEFAIGEGEAVHSIDPRVIPVDNDTIKIENGVLKAQGGGSGSQLYLHCIKLDNALAGDRLEAYANVITNTPDAFTTTTLYTYLLTRKFLLANGILYSSSRTASDVVSRMKALGGTIYVVHVDTSSASGSESQTQAKVRSDDVAAI